MPRALNAGDLFDLKQEGDQPFLVPVCKAGSHSNGKSGWPAGSDEMGELP